MGNLLAVVVHAANIHDTKSGIMAENDVADLLGLGVDISQRISSEWQALPKGWIVERTLAWMKQFQMSFQR